MKKNFSKVSAALATAFLALTAQATIKSEAVPGEYVVRLKQNVIRANSITELSNQLQAYVKSTIPGQNIIVVKKPVFQTEDSAIQALKANVNVEFAEPNYIYRINRVPNDAMFGQLWGMNNAGQTDTAGQVGTAGVDINVEKAWDIQTGTKDKIVAVIDTGIDYTHPDLKDNMWTNDAEVNGKAGVDDDGNGFIDDIYGINAITGTGDPKDDHGHGSHCAGTIGAKGNNGTGVAGVNWDVRLMAVKFLDKDGSGTLENAIKGIDYATKMGAKVLSNSWGGGSFSQNLQDAIQRSNDAGALFIVAAGNDYNDNDVTPTYPASYPVSNVVAVAAIDNQGNKADFSNYGKTSVHVAAPGVNIVSTTGGVYESFSGTSMATPHVAGVAALIWANEPNLTAHEIKSRLIATVHPMTNLRGKIISGGRIDAYAALTNTVAPPDPNDPSNWPSTPISYQSDHPYAANVNQTYEINVPGAAQIALYFATFDTETKYDTVSLYDSAGTLVQTLSGLNNDSFSLPITGSYAKLVFKSDNSVQHNGWSITKAAYR